MPEIVLSFWRCLTSYFQPSSVPPLLTLLSPPSLFFRFLITMQWQWWSAGSRTLWDSLTQQVKIVKSLCGWMFVVLGAATETVVATRHCVDDVCCFPSVTVFVCLPLQVRRTTTDCDPSATLRPTSSSSVSPSYHLLLLRTSERRWVQGFQLRQPRDLSASVHY